MVYWKVLVCFLTVTSVLMSAGYTMLIPFLPMYLIEELGVSTTEVNIWSGIIFSSTFFNQCHHGPDLGGSSRQEKSQSNGGSSLCVPGDRLRLGRLCVYSLGAFCHALLPRLLGRSLARLSCYHDFDSSTGKNGVVSGHYARRHDRWWRARSLIRRRAR